MGGKMTFSNTISPQAEKMIFLKKSVAHLPIETKPFCFYQNFISSGFQRNHGGEGVNFRLKNCRSPKKLLYFYLFFCCTSTHRDETFMFLPKFHTFNGLDFKKKRVFLLIVLSRPKKIAFLDFSCFFEIVTSRRNFFVLTKISYLQRFGF